MAIYVSDFVWPGGGARPTLGNIQLWQWAGAPYLQDRHSIIIGLIKSKRHVYRPLVDVCFYMSDP
jgi:hypothetical protein